MERLLALKLDARHCVAAARLNGFALACVRAGQDSLSLPVNEYAVNGRNRLELLITAPDGDPWAAERSSGRFAEEAVAVARLLLPRVGSPVSEDSARSLAQLEWSSPANETAELPLHRVIEVDLPVSFPVWRWCKAPPCEISEDLRVQALEVIDEVASALAQGDPEPFLQLTRLRGEEIAQAYQREPHAEYERLRQQLIDWHAAGALEWEARDAADCVLRPSADGRLLECLTGTGLPLLRTQADKDGIARSFPLRFAVVAGKIYVLR